MFAFLLSALKTQSLQQTVCILSLIVQVVLTFLVVSQEQLLGFWTGVTCKAVTAAFCFSTCRDGACRWLSG